MLSVCQRGGLCNRLLTVLSHAFAERREGRSILVFWPDSRDFPAIWEQCFLPIEGVITLPQHPPFEYADVKDTRIPDCLRMLHRESYSLEDHWWGKGCQWAPILNELIPSCEVKEMLPCGEYDAVHIRRTDLNQLIEMYKWPPQRLDEEYDRFIQESDAEFVWLACDNPVTQLRVREKHKDRLRFVGEMKNTEDYTYWDGKVRHTSGQWAAADMFACVGARNFLGSKHSSFTAMIEMLRDRCMNTVGTNKKT